jgi:hypothetical protein
MPISSPTIIHLNCNNFYLFSVQNQEKMEKMEEKKRNKEGKKEKLRILIIFYRFGE